MGVHQWGAGDGLRESSVSWRSVEAHAGGGAGPDVRPATTSEVRTSKELRRHRLSLEAENRGCLTNFPNGARTGPPLNETKNTQA